MRGPFLRVVDEHSHFYKRGQPAPMDSHTAQLLLTSPFHNVFPYRARRQTHEGRSSNQEGASCAWRGDYAWLTGPFLEVQDDDNHIYRRACRFEICSKTLAVLDSFSYRRHFAFMDRASWHRSD
jgi:hypothetical protein